jgi:protein phosphatase
MIKGFATTHIGQRKLNEDSFYLNEKQGLFVVADGVGGMSKGEVASNLACQTIETEIQSGKTLNQAILTAHQIILDKISESNEHKGMATTIVVVKFVGNYYEIAWVGDSRVYLWDGQLKLLTRDHSYVEMLLYNGHIKIEDLETHPDKNVISQALGITRKKLSVSNNSGTLEKDQMLLICSDGLYGALDEIELINGIKNNSNIETLTESLVKKAADNGGKDNITLITVKSNNDSCDENKVVLAKVIRTFNNSDGKVVNTDISHSQQVKIITKSVMPKEIIVEDNTHVNKQDNSLKNLIYLLSLIVLILMLVINLKI